MRTVPGQGTLLPRAFAHWIVGDDRPGQPDLLETGADEAPGPDLFDPLAELDAFRLRRVVPDVDGELGGIPRLDLRVAVQERGEALVFPQFRRQFPA
jgi:hypothetical protein